VALLGSAILLVCWEQRALWPPRPKVEFLPTQYPAPSWDGSYPALVIDVKAAKFNRPTFSASISMRKPTVQHDEPVDQFEVDLSTGLFTLRKTDIFVQDVIPLVLTRTYRPWDYENRAFGIGTNHPYDISPTGPRFPYSSIDMNLEDNREVHFDRISKGTGYADAVHEHHATSSEFYGARIWWNGNGWTLHFLDGRVDVFPEAYWAQSYAQGAATEMQDAAGHRIVLQRDRHRNLERLVSPSGHAINFTYDLSDQIIEAWDDVGNFRKYSYTAGGHLQTVSDWSHVLYRFEYQNLLRCRGCDPYLMTAIMDGDWNVLLRNVYDNGRIAQQRLANGEVYKYKYVVDSNDKLSASTLTFPKGREKRFYFQKGILVRQE
jgi:Domain of unknown function (DUF6531)